MQVPVLYKKGELTLLIVISSSALSCLIFPTLIKHIQERKIRQCTVNTSNHPTMTNLSSTVSTRKSNFIHTKRWKLIKPKTKTITDDFTEQSERKYTDSKSLTLFLFACDLASDKPKNVCIGGYMHVTATITTCQPIGSVSQQIFHCVVKNLTRSDQCPFGKFV